MKTLDIRNVGFRGINTDLSQSELPPEFITDGKNFRVKDGKLCSSKSEYIWDTNGAAIEPGLIIPVRDEFWIIAGVGDVYAYDGATFTDITSTALAAAPMSSGNELDWNSCFLGNIPLINNWNHVPEYWSPQTAVTDMAPLPYESGGNDWATEGWSCKVLRSHGSFLFALYMTESGVDYPDVFRWSHPSDINGLPPSWNEDDLSYIAGRSAIGGNYGSLVDGGSIRDSFSLYSTKGINILDPSGDELIWRKRELSSSIGVLADNCWAEIKGSHLVLGEVDILMNNGTKIESFIHKKLRTRMINNVNPEYFSRSFVARNDRYKEVWFCIPEGNSEYPNIAYVYNWKDDTWAIQELPDNTVHASFGLKLDPPLTYASADSAGTTYADAESDGLTYAGQVRSPLNNRLISVDTSDNLYVVDPEIATASDTDCYIERQNLPIEGHKSVKTLIEIYPQITGDAVTITIGSHEFSGASVVWESPVTFTPGTDSKIDVMLTGALFAYKIESIGSDGFEFSGMEIVYNDAGQR